MWRLLTSCLSVIMLGTSLAVEPSGPVCSKYDYEEKLLERVLRNELALKGIFDKITETHEKVKDTLKIIQEENAKLNDAMHALEVKKKELDDKVDSFIDSGIQNVSESVGEMKTTVQALVKELEVKKQDLDNTFYENVEEMNTTVKALVAQTAKELDVMKEQSLVPLIMFHARLHDREHEQEYKQDVVFKEVLVNEGGGYDPDTGHFTASVAGVYMFTVQYCPNFSSTINLEIVHEDRPLQRAATLFRHIHACVSMQAFAKVVMGDKIWVRCMHGGNVFSVSTHNWNSFAGLLINV